MSTAGGPKAVTNGLVYAVDAGDNNSFKGESTTNLATNPHSLTTNYASSAVGSNGTNLNFTGEFNAGTVTGPGWFARTGTGGNGTNGVRYTTSWYLKAGTLSTVSVDWGGSHQGNVTTFVANLRTGTVSSVSLAAGESYGIERMPNDFWRVWYSSTLTTGTAYYPQLTLGSGNIIVGGIQIEQKSYPTRFVNGSRGTTVVAGGGLADLTTNGNHGELLNGVREGADFVTFDGTDDYILTSDIGSLSRFTVDTWSRPTSYTNNYACIASSTYPGANSTVNFKIGYSGGQNITGGTYNPFDGWRETPAISVALNSWVHIVFTYDGSNLTIYKNGVSGGSTSFSATAGYPASGGGGIRIGRRWDNPDCFAGNIASIKVYNRAFSSVEIQQSFNAYRGRFNV